MSKFILLSRTPVHIFKSNQSYILKKRILYYQSGEKPIVIIFLTGKSVDDMWPYVHAVTIHTQ